MPTIETKGLDRIVSDQAAAAQSSALQSSTPRVLDFSPGSIFLAFSHAFGAVGLWLQAQILKVLASTRLSTSTDEDAITFVKDFGVEPVLATRAGGNVVISRFTTGSSAFVPLGALVRTSDSTATFQIEEDVANPFYSQTAVGYLIPANVASISVPVRALTPGLSGNVSAGTITLMASSVPGISAVNNPTAMVGGADGETADQLRARFPVYITSLSKATEGAIRYAVSTVQAGLTILIQEGPTAAALGVDFVVVVDDGTGSPSGALINRVSDAVELYRATGVTFTVVGADVLPANISLDVETVDGSNSPAVLALVVAAVQKYVNTLALGQSLSVTRIAQVAYISSTDVANVLNITINGAAVDLAPVGRQVIRSGVITVS